MQPMKRTNGREGLAFVLATGIRIAIGYGLGSAMLPLYQMGRGGLGPFGNLAGWSLGFFLTIAALGLFILLRGLIGGVPPMVADRRHAIRTSENEVGAWMFGWVAQLPLSLLNTLWSLWVYTSFPEADRVVLFTSMSLGYSAVSATIFFLVFIVLRRNFSIEQIEIPYGAVR